MESFKQKPMKACKETGSFMNMLMSNNKTVPQAGKGATILSWTDRHAYEVVYVSKDGKTVDMCPYHAERVDKDGMSESQTYKYEKLSANRIRLKWMRGAWRQVNDKVVFEDNFYKEYEDLVNDDPNREKTDMLDKLYMKPLFDENGDLQLVKGKTKVKTEYSKVNVIFGVKDEYYDYSF
jgi:type II secretory pathway component GspD/PulD (secretin)